MFRAKLPPSNFYKKEARNTDARCFAMKRFSKKQFPGRTTSILNEFAIECDNVKKFEKWKHKHIVTFHASFTDEVYYGFIMSPVAELTLKDLLEQSKESNVILGKERDSLFEAFGCLLEAVRHLHVDVQMRRCDLKPSNILVCHYKDDHFYVRLCDLGLAHAWISSQMNQPTKNIGGLQGIRRRKSNLRCMEKTRPTIGRQTSFRWVALFLKCTRY